MGVTTKAYYEDLSKSRSMKLYPEQWQRGDSCRSCKKRIAIEEIAGFSKVEINGRTQEHFYCKPCWVAEFALAAVTHENNTGEELELGQYTTWFW